jgi:hypothetical protein
MLLEVHEDVRDPASRFRRGAQLMNVIAVVPNSPASDGGVVDCASGSRRETAEALIESARVVRLDDEVDVIVLDREVSHAEPQEHRRRDRSSEWAEHALGAERGNLRVSSHRHVERTARVVPTARPMGRARTISDQFSAGPGTSTAPVRRLGQLELFWSSTRHDQLSGPSTAVLRGNRRWGLGRDGRSLNQAAESLRLALAARLE